MTLEPTRGNSTTKTLQAATALITEGPKALKWFYKNAAYHVTIPVKFHPKAALNEKQPEQFDAGLTDLFKRYTATIKKTHISDACNVLNAKMEKKGACHGSCLALLELVLKNPSLRSEQLMDILSKRSDRLTYFQSVEIIREALCDAAAKEDASKLHDSIQSSFFPKVEEGLELRFSDIKEVVEVFTGLKEKICLVRCWNERLHTSAHSLLFCYSEKNEHFWFFDYKVFGIFAYKNFPDLLKGFVSHLEAYVGKACTPGGIFWIEQYTFGKDLFL